MFNEARLLDQVAYGSQFGQEFKTGIKTLRSGQERRNAEWAAPLGRFSVMYDNIRDEQHEIVYAAHMASMGSAIGFRFKNWADYKADKIVVGAGTGSPQVVQLVRNYQFGAAVLSKKIYKPVVGTVQMFADDQPITSDVDHTLGLVTLSAPAGSVLTWSGEFDVPVRFVSDRLDVDTLGTTEKGMLVLSSDVSLKEIRDPS